MTTEEAKKILLNSYPMATKHDLDDENKANKEAIEVVLKELDKKDKLIEELKKSKKVLIDGYINKCKEYERLLSDNEIF